MSNFIDEAKRERELWNAAQGLAEAYVNGSDCRFFVHGKGIDLTEEDVIEKVAEAVGQSDEGGDSRSLYISRRVADCLNITESGDRYVLEMNYPFDGEDEVLEYCY